MQPPVALTIAGVDSGGCAGIAADLHTFAAHGVFATLAVAALTAQDTTAVYATRPVEADFLALELDAVLGDFAVVAAKTGMLATSELVELVAARAESGRLPRLVVDPVMVATSGSPLVAGDPAAAYRRLLAQAAVVTPNLPETEALLGGEVRTRSQMAEAARALAALGARLAVVKGGHLDGDEAVDVCCEDGTVTVLSSPRVATRNAHGTGCALSAAITANLARGLAPLAAVRAAKAYVEAALRGGAAWALGHGPGPLDLLGTPAPAR